MAKDNRAPTPGQIAVRIRRYLTDAGKGEEFQNGYIAAMELCGYLKPTAPEWMRRSAAIYYTHPTNQAKK